jgi:hypothetical protein
LPFVYKPSLWGFVASAIFLVLTVIELQDSHWVDSIMWGLLAVSFTVKYLPKFLIFSVPGGMVSLITLVAGGAIFVADTIDKIGNG